MSEFEQRCAGLWNANEVEEKDTDNLDVIGYSGSDFVGCVDSRKLTSGYIFMMAGGAIS